VAKNIHNDVLDAALNVIKNNANQMALCSQEPSTRDEALVTYMLAVVPISATDFTIADGDVSGRKAIVAEQLSVLVSATGTGTHISLVDNTRLLYTTDCISQIVTQDNLLDLPTWDIEIQDPTP